jgi:MtN3 and saliva related transmembrane protein
MGIMDAVTFLGMAAGTLTTISFLPQVIRTWKTRSAKDISAGMFMLFCAGIFLWILYGVSINSLPVIITNIVTFILAFIILVLKLRNG